MRFRGFNTYSAFGTFFCDTVFALNNTRLYPLLQRHSPTFHYKYEDTLSGALGARAIVHHVGAGGALSRAAALCRWHPLSVYQRSGCARGSQPFQCEVHKKQMNSNKSVRKTMFS